MKLTDFDKEINSAMTEAYQRITIGEMGFKRRQLIPRVDFVAIGLSEKELVIFKNGMNSLLQLIIKERNAI